MDTALVDAFLNQYNMGLKVNGTFVSKAYDNIVEELAKSINIKIEKSQVKNRWKILKKHFSDAYDIFKNGMSGFTIDPVTQLWMAEPEVWNDLIKVKPQAKIYMQNPVPHYEKMVILYGKDRATGNHSVTASELRKRSNLIDVEDFTDSTHDIDPTMSQFSAQNTSHYVDDDMEIIPPSPSEGVSPSLHGAGGGNKKSKNL
ncbi:Myb/SANT-like domain-containing protein [Dioscorea alata]|uniref:Myb/SANT-like domain-containing protein n=1 Tax=Dioscorea alata TaxID=55571 RepID=A0ACB7UYM6_DIOAL|nr:Myb/SANT-like domain-containing protein [Dioscorea alata]